MVTADQLRTSQAAISMGRESLSRYPVLQHKPNSLVKAPYYSNLIDTDTHTNTHKHIHIKQLNYSQQSPMAIIEN